MTLLIIAVIIALLFDVINGFHDAANSIATVVSTRVLSPALAVIWAAFFNFIALFIFVPRVADTIAKIVTIEANDPTYITLVTCGLLGAILWDLLTWWIGLPTSSSHALIGGLAGAAFAYAGLEAIRLDVLLLVVEFIVIAPLMGFVLGFIFIIGLYWLIRFWSPRKVQKTFSKGQLLSAALYSIGHGANDAQKTMGVIMALLIAGGLLDHNVELSLVNPKTSWIILSCHAAMSLGTALGGWRIVKTMGMKITKLQPIGGFCAESAGACTLFLATHYGIPVSTTHTITGAIIGTGSATRAPSKIKWGIAADIIWAWILTIPASAVLSAIIFLLSSKL